MPSSVSRGPITTRIVTELETANFPVGDNSSPTVPFGWQGEPNESSATFIPWMSATPGAAQSQRIPGAMGDTGTEWRIAYNVFFAGVTRKQCEALADRIRDALTNIVREKIETPTGAWKIQKIGCEAIGSNNRVGSAYPDYFTQADSYTVWISKG